MDEKKIAPMSRCASKVSSFTALNISQTLITLNDSIFRLIVAFSLIDFLGADKSNQILAISAALFVSPFLLFSMPAGQLADRYSKRTLILWTLWAEVIFMLIGIFAIYTQHVIAAYFALFLVALQSSVFNPAKYSILPEIVEKERISQVNGVMTLCTYLAIIFGTFLASFMSEVTGRNYLIVTLFCSAIAIIGLVFGFFIEKTPAQDPERKINFLFIVQVFKSLKDASRYRYLLLACFASAYFLFTAAYTQLNLIPFGIQSLGISDVQAGYIFLAAAMGVGMGSTLVAIFSGKNVELGISIWGAIGTGISYLLLFLLQHHLIAVVLLVMSVGMHGGLYVVPLDAYIQVASPEKKRGAIVAASTFLSFFAVLVSSGYLALMGDVLMLSGATGFLIVGFITLGIATYIVLALPDQLARLFAIVLARIFFTIKSSDDLPQQSLLLSDERSHTVFFSLVHSFQKIRFLQLREEPCGIFLKLYYRIFNKIPLCFDEERNPISESLKELHTAYQNGYTFCFFTHDEEALRYQETVREVFQNFNMPIYLANIERSLPDKYHAGKIHFFQLLHTVFHVKLTDLAKESAREGT